MLPLTIIKSIKLQKHSCFKLLFLIVAFSCVIPSSVSCQSQISRINYEEIQPVITQFGRFDFERPSFPERFFDIKDFGAIEGGKFLNTKSIQAAIDSAAKVGGGYIVIPKGKWLTGAIHLENNINLYLDKNAELLFSQDPNDYLPVVFSRHEDVECYKYSAFIYANNKTNIAITGEGVLNGQGQPWWKYKIQKKDSELLLYQMGNENVPVEKRLFDGRDGKALRPAFFQPMSCKNILVEGVTFLYGAFWTITPTYCENVIIRKVKIITQGELGKTPNGDGVNPSSSKNVLIEYCEFDTGDDCIAIKAGRDNDGLRVNKPTENIFIRYCTGKRGHGGIVIGSETSGGLKNIYAENCEFDGTDRIVRIKTARGRGGIIENMWFKNLKGCNIQKEALHINMLYTGTRFPAYEVNSTTPIIRNINYENITISSGETYGIEILGLPEMNVENINFKGITISTTKGINMVDVKNIFLNNIIISPLEDPQITIIDGNNIKIDTVSFLNVRNNIIHIEGAKTGNIKIIKSNISDLIKYISIAPEVSIKSIDITE